MHGTIKTFAQEKGYGFIKGDDSKDYYFRSSSFKSVDHIERICEDVPVEFDQVATSKGYRAENCVITDLSSVTAYIEPDKATGLSMVLREIRPMRRVPTLFRLPWPSGPMRSSMSSITRRRARNRVPDTVPIISRFTTLWPES